MVGAAIRATDPRTDRATGKRRRGAKRPTRKAAFECAGNARDPLLTRGRGGVETAKAGGNCGIPGDGAPGGSGPSGRARGGAEAAGVARPGERGSEQRGGYGAAFARSTGRSPQRLAGTVGTGSRGGASTVAERSRVCPEGGEGPRHRRADGACGRTATRIGGKGGKAGRVFQARFRIAGETIGRNAVTRQRDHGTAGTACGSIRDRSATGGQRLSVAARRYSELRPE